MRTTLRSIAFVVIAGTLSVTSSLAQTDPLNPAASQTQPNQPGRVQSPTPSLRDSEGAPNETVQEMKDKMFLRKAAEGGLSQVQLAQLASTNSASAEVKELSQKLVDEHTKLNASMAAVADQIGVRLPSKIGKGNQEKYDKLKALSGDAFDKEYLACAMRDHHEDLREFRVEAQTTTDPDLKALVDQGAKVLRENLVMTAKLAALNGVPIPKHASKPEPTPPATQ